MKKTDKILIGIVAGIVLLVVVAFGVALSKPKPVYQTDDKPEGVAFNYLFALQQGDYQRAYGYLSPSILHYPRDLEKFTNDVQDNSWMFNGLNNASITLEVDSTKVTGKLAYIKIKETSFYEDGLFNSNQSTSIFKMTLRQDEKGQWRIEDADRYWAWCWSNSSYYGCK
jgi:hypothetical protein